MFRKIYDRIPRFIKNKYFLVLVPFAVAMLFLIENNILFSQMKLWKDLNKLQKEKVFYENEIRNDSIQVQRLVNDSMEAEKLGREKYMMKRDSEDIFLIVRKPKVKK